MWTKDDDGGTTLLECRTAWLETLQFIVGTLPWKQFAFYDLSKLGKSENHQK